MDHLGKPSQESASVGGVKKIPQGKAKKTTHPALEGHSHRSVGPQTEQATQGRDEQEEREANTPSLG